IEGLVGDQPAKLDIFDQRRDADSIEALARQQNKSHEIAQRIGQRQAFGRQTDSRLANGMASRPPFAPCPSRSTRTVVASTMAYSMSGSSEAASNIRLKTPAFTQSRKRLKTVFQGPNDGGRSRQGLPVRAIHSTASTNNRASPPVRPGSVALPRQKGCIFSHCASVKLNQPIAKLLSELESRTT